MKTMQGEPKVCAKPDYPSKQKMKEFLNIPTIPDWLDEVDTIITGNFVTFLSKILSKISEKIFRKTGKLQKLETNAQEVRYFETPFDENNFLMTHTYDSYPTHDSYL